MEDNLQPGATGTPTGNTNADGAAAVQNPSFIESLPEDIRGHEAIKNFDSAEKLARAHLETLGKVVIPPESADKYEITVPDGKQVNQEFLSGFKAWAHEAGLSQKQAAALAEKYLAFEDAQLAAYSKAAEAQVNAVKIEWGDKFDANVAIAHKAVEQFCTAEDKRYLDESGLGNNPTLVRMFYKIGLAMNDDTMGQGRQGSAGQQMPRTSGGTPQLNFPSMQPK